MLMRSTLLACAAIMMAAMFAPASADVAAPCEETSFRIYFAEGSTSIDPTARHMMNVAERQVAGCAYAALRVSIDGASPHASSRAAAIREAADDRVWDAVQIDPRGTAQRAPEAPEFAEVTVTPRPLAPAEADDEGAAGV